MIESEEEAKIAVVSEEGCHSLATPDWETERRREAKTPEGNAVEVEPAPS